MAPLFQGQRTPTLTPRGCHSRPAPYRSRASIIHPDLGLAADLITQIETQPRTNSTPITQSPTGRANDPPPLMESEADSDSDAEEDLYPNTTTFIAGLDLGRIARGVASELSSMPLVRRKATIFSTLASILQRMDHLENSPRLVQPGPTPPHLDRPLPSVPDNPGAEGTFTFGRRFKASITIDPT
ncbi:uncharacterized protein PGTG_22476 [Puccinia graminis f. sp. tritici CRL 75-36-700-3]|uniref:Uncharacterized protein n=1 Tax=Puccinia graminis f. sp. tritici (strain CRL 75-36-700-3 / race SCCL) TaxID=418459 RepID=H6QUP5_PUCGT|nr:uncharacterized protein PGTG_22476 [Puccinia graminis f. sp. tritici CRL 75-36-700-3]EHS64757.1 hypothetical protein PGTG_22476 [Puccinia graminis f. sp. tritici CRL 75-36-700-3]